MTDIPAGSKGRRSDSKFVRIIITSQCWYMRGGMGDLSVEMLIDTGSVPNLLSISVYEGLSEFVKRPLRKSDTRLYAANGAELAVYGETVVDFLIGEMCYQVPMLVAELPGAQGILGMEFLMNHECTLNLYEGYLESKGSKHPLYKLRPDGCHRIYLAHPLKIADGDTAMVKGILEGEFQENQRAVWEPTEPLRREAGLHSVEPQIEVVNGGEVQLRIMNLGGEEVTLPPGITIGYMTPDNGQAGDQGTPSVYYIHHVNSESPVPNHLSELYEKALTNLNESQAGELGQFLYKNGRSFVGPGIPLGRTDLVKHRIDVGDARPIKQPSRRLPISDQEIVNAEVERLLEEGLIEPSDSPWSSPVVLTTKKDGTPRLCVDLRRVNNVTRKDAYPLPNIQECLDSLSGAKWFCSLDLACGFWQVEVDERDQDKTAFVTKKGLFQWKVVPFGLCNAPATFERLMEKVLRGLQWQICNLFIDDLVVHGRTFEEMMANLQAVFDRINAAGLRHKPSKCTLCKRKVAFLGHVVSADGVMCDPAKLEAVAEWPTPKTVTEIRSFLGLAGYYRRFIAKFSAIAAPMIKLTEKNRPFVWDEACEEAFVRLKACLMDAPILAYPNTDPAFKFVLDTDCSGQAMGAVLSQVQDGVEKVIAYGSKTLNAAQRNYCVTYRELLSLVYFLKYFRHFLIGRKILVRSDHASLRWLMNFKDCEGMVGRWLAKLAVYDFQIEHRIGKDHGNADGLSRRVPTPKRHCERPECPDCPPIQAKQGRSPKNQPNPPDKREAGKEDPSVDLKSAEKPALIHQQKEKLEAGLLVLPINEGNGESSGEAEEALDAPADPSNVGAEANDPVQSNWVDSWSKDALRTFQKGDADICQVSGWIENDDSKPARAELVDYSEGVRSLCAMWASLQVEEGILYRKWTPKYTSRREVLQLVAPPELREEIFGHVHESSVGGHLGVTKTLEKIRVRYYWPGCKSDIRRWCSQCNTCAQVKAGPNYQARMQSMRAVAPLDIVALDVLGELPETDNGNKYILVVSDYFTKWVEAYPMPNQTAQTTADIFVREFVTRLGCPRQLHSDQGRNFESTLCQEMCKILDIRKTRTTPYHSRGDGLVERFNRTLQAMLKSVVNDRRDDWDERLPYVMMAYRSSTQESISCSPFLMLYGREITLPVDLVVGTPRPLSSQYECETEYVEWLRSTIQDCHNFARQRLKAAAKRQKGYYDAHSKPYQYRTGDLVWRWYPPKGKGKLSKGWTGPYKIQSMPTEVNCEMQLTPESEMIRVHVDALKPYLGHTPACWAVELGESSSEEETEEVGQGPPEVGSKAAQEPPPESEEDSGEGSCEEEEGQEEPEVRKSGRDRRAPTRIDW